MFTTQLLGKYPAAKKKPPVVAVFSDLSGSFVQAEPDPSAIGFGQSK
jgi:hypothetical protein